MNVLRVVVVTAIQYLFVTKHQHPCKILTVTIFTKCGTTSQLNWWGRPHSRSFELNIICLCKCVCVVLVLDSVTCIFGYGT